MVFWTKWCISSPKIRAGVWGVAESFVCDFKEKIVMHMICALFWWDVQLQSADFVGLWWAWGFDGRRREHSGLPWLWFLSRAMVWSSCCASDWQLSVVWSLESEVVSSLLFSLSLDLCVCVFWSLSLILLTFKNHLFMWQRLHRVEAYKQYWVWNLSSSASGGKRKLSRGHCSGIEERYHWRHYQKCWEFNRLGEELAPCFLIIATPIHHQLLSV